MNDFSLVHLTLLLSLHYLAKCRSRCLAVYNNEFILESEFVGSKNHWRPQNRWKFVPYLTVMIFILRSYVVNWNDASTVNETLWVGGYKTWCWQVASTSTAGVRAGCGHFDHTLW